MYYPVLLTKKPQEYLVTVNYLPISPLKLPDLFPSLKNSKCSNYFITRIQELLNVDNLEYTKSIREELQEYEIEQMKLADNIILTLLINVNVNVNNIYDTINLFGIYYNIKYVLSIYNKVPIISHSGLQHYRIVTTVNIINIVINHSRIDPLRISLSLESMSMIKYYVNDVRSNLICAYHNCKTNNTKNIIKNRIINILFLCK